jgi:hypothetical protein
LNRKAKRNIWLGALLTMLWSGLSLGQSSPLPGGSTTWEALAAERVSDVEAGRWQRIVDQLKTKGFPIELAKECLAPAQEAAQQGLPADFVLTRIEEGVAKEAEAKVLREAGRQRLLNLRNAAAVLRQGGYGSRNAVHDQLMQSVTLALESGLSADTLQGVLIRAKGGQSERMRSIVESGETMRLNGMDETTVRQMMTDFTERNMRRTEIMRASRFAVQQHKAHVDGARIRQQLWSGTGAGGRWDRGENAPGAGEPGLGTGGPAVQGRGPTESGGQSGKGGSSTSPGNTPPDAGGGGGRGGEGHGGSGGSGGQEGNAPMDAGPHGSTQDRGR